MLSTTTTSSRPLLLLLSRPLLPRLLHSHHPPPRSYSTTTPPSPLPLLTTTDIPAPHTGHIRILTLSSPSNRNALSLSLLDSLTTSIRTIHDETEAEWARLMDYQKTLSSSSSPPSNDAPPPTVGTSTRALILASSHPTTFSAGADLVERRAFTPAQTTDFLSNLRSTLHLLSNLNIPTIASIHGHALGGGFELALATTFRVIGETAVVGLPETRLGIIPGAGGTWRLRGLVGEGRAVRWVVGGERRGGREAVGEGVGDLLVEEDGQGDGQGGMREKVLEASVGLARRICEGGPVAVGAGLRAVKGAGREGEGERGEAEREMYEVVRRTRDRDEALVAFREKRRAVFRGY